MVKPPRRTRDDWTQLGLEAIADEGVGAVAIERLARRGGASKGSLYWHFENRDDLLAATLERWEREHTDGLIAFSSNGAGPLERLRLLLGAVMYPPVGLEVELALLSCSDEPLVTAAVARVSERRIAYLANEFEVLGLPTGEARRRAVTAYSVYLGQAQMMRSAPASVPQGPDEQAQHVREVVALLFEAPAVSSAG